MCVIYMGEFHKYIYHISKIGKVSNIGNDIWGVPQMDPQNDWLIPWENPMKMDDLDPVDPVDQQFAN